MYLIPHLIKHTFCETICLQCHLYHAYYALDELFVHYEWISFEKYFYRTAVLYRVIHKSLRDFRTRLRNNQDRHGRKEHINK